MCCKLKRLMILFIIFTISSGIINSIAKAQTGIELLSLLNYPFFSNQSIQMPYLYAPFNRKGNILLNNYNYIYGFPFFSNQSTLWASLEVPVYKQEDTLLNKIDLFNRYSYANPTIPGWSSSFPGQPVQIPSWEPSFYKKGDSIINNFYYYFNHPYYGPINPGSLNPWSYLWSKPSGSEDQEPEPETINPIFNYLKLFRMGPLYAQKGEPYRYLFISDYSVDNTEVHNRYGHEIEYLYIFNLMLNPDNFLKAQDPYDMNDPVVRYWIDLGADPNLFGENDPNIAALFKKDQFIVDLSLPIFADSNLRMNAGGPGPLARCLIDQGSLGWNLTISAKDPNDAQDFFLNPLHIDPYDGMPTYLPADYAGLDAMRELGKPYFPPDLVRLIEGALWNAGVTVWPNVCALDYMPQPKKESNTGGYIPPYSFKNLNITIEVTNGVDSDAMTFLFIVIEDPVDNYAPVIESDFIKLTNYFNEDVEYVIKYIDPDCFIFSISEEPTTTHLPGLPISENFRNDMDEILWSIEKTIFPASDDWIKPLPGPEIRIENSKINWLPEFGYNCANTYHFIVTCQDSFGETDSAEILILCLGTWCGHHPIIIFADWPKQIKISSGEEYRLYFKAEDPDGDEVHTICNIGTVEKAPEGFFIWKYKSNASSASYTVQIVVYDTGGGHSVIQFSLDVES